MTSLVIIKTVFFSFLLFELSNAANILGIFSNGKRQQVLGEVLLKELARRGHNVTVATPFPTTYKVANYSEIHLKGIQEELLKLRGPYRQVNYDLVTGSSILLDVTRMQTELILNNTQMRQLAKTGENQKFDLIIIDWFLNYAHLVYGEIFDAPVIPISSGGAAFIPKFLGNPAPPSYVSTGLLPLPSNMTLSQRLINSLVHVGRMLVEEIDIRYHENLLQRYFNETFSFLSLQKRVPVFFSNTHYTVDGVRPLLPNIIPVAGLHIEPTEDLPLDLGRFIDEAEEGAIYFNLEISSLSEQQQNNVLQALGKLKQRVVCKWKLEDTIPVVPKNVMLRSWLPQNNILAHPKIKLFISHGSLLSTIEAIHHSVPIIGIPMLPDQKCNIAKAVTDGYAIELNYASLNDMNLGRAINEILTKPKFKENVVKLSRLLKEQPVSPLENAVFWVEHVIYYKGAPHLQNSGIYLRWYEYILLDVILIIGGILIFILLILYYVMKQVFQAIKQLYEKEKVD